MNFKSSLVAAGMVAAAALAAAPSQAAAIPDGTLTVAALFNPVVDPVARTFSVNAGATRENGGDGGFVGAANLNAGVMNGTLTFGALNTTVTLAQTLNDFFVFTDNAGDTFHFSVDKITTEDFKIEDSGNHFTLFLLGNTWEEGPNASDLTPTSLRLQFNNTGSSLYSASATLAVPPVKTTVPPPPAVPEPASWAMMVGGFGAMGAAMRAGRRRNRNSVTFA